MCAARRVALVPFGLAHRAGGLEGLGDLVVQFDAVGDDYKRPVARHLAQHLLREEHHRETLAAALRLPKDTQLSRLAFPLSPGAGVRESFLFRSKDWIVLFTPRNW